MPVCLFGQAGLSKEDGWVCSALFQLFPEFIIFQYRTKRGIAIKNSKHKQKDFRLLENLIPDCLVHESSSVY